MKYLQLGRFMVLILPKVIVAEIVLTSCDKGNLYHDLAMMQQTLLPIELVWCCCGEYQVYERLFNRGWWDWPTSIRRYSLSKNQQLQPTTSKQPHQPLQPITPTQQHIVHMFKPITALSYLFHKSVCYVVASTRRRLNQSCRWRREGTQLWTGLLCGVCVGACRPTASPSTPPKLTFKWIKQTSHCGSRVRGRRKRRRMSERRTRPQTCQQDLPPCVWPTPFTTVPSFDFSFVCLWTTLSHV